MSGYFKQLNPILYPYDDAYAYDGGDGDDYLCFTYRHHYLIFCDDDGVYDAFCFYDYAALLQNFTNPHLFNDGGNGSDGGGDFCSLLTNFSEQGGYRDVLLNDRGYCDVYAGSCQE